MLERLLTEVCQKMSAILDESQVETLKNVLFITFHNKKIVDDKAEIILSSDDKDEQMLQMFAASKKISGRKNNTLKQYVNEIRNCRAVIGKSFTDITTMDLRWYLGMAKESRGNKMSTVRNKIRYLNSFFTFLVNEDIIVKNPVSRIETPKIDQTILKPFSSEDIEALIKSCVHVRDRAMIEFMYATGLRVSELVSLNVGDIDMYKKEFVVLGKGSKERVVYFSDRARFHLREYLKWRAETEWKSISQMEKEKLPLFATKREPHGRISRAGVEALCRKLGREAGVEDTHPHRFRRTFATDMISRGMQLQELMKLMGHTKMDTTLIYCDVVQESIRNSYYKCA